MTNNQPSEPLVFRDRSIRRVWHKNKWYFSIVDICGVLTGTSEYQTARKYWNKLSQRLREEGGEVVTFCHRLKIKALDGKMRGTDCANTEGVLRIVQSIPSPKAEPFKRWLAKVGKERLEEIEDPELSMMRMKEIYKQKGYPEEWIEKRTRGIAVRNELTGEWESRGAQKGLEYSILTNEIMQGTFSMKVADYKDFKGLDKENLRDHMTDIELILAMLGEATTTTFTKNRDSQGFSELKQDAKEGGEVVGKTRRDIEARGGSKVVTRENYLSFEKKLLE